jgi:hypothetical protein
VTRVHARIGTFDEKPVTLVPMRVHMLRNAIYWAAQGLTANSQFRSAAVEWNGRPATCLLVSDRPEAGDSPARRWNESEYCIDNETSLLQILSIAPGSYTVYSYAGQSFHGQPMPDRIITYLDGAPVIDATFRMNEPGVAANGVPALTAEMIARGTPVTLDEPLKAIVNVAVNVAGESGSVEVHAQIGPDGKVVEDELCAAADPSLAARALDRVKTMQFGRSETQRQGYIEVRFAPESAISAAPLSVRPVPTSPPAQPSIPIQPYYLERTVTFPPQSSDLPGVNVTKEILARRSDGAIVNMETNRLDKSGQYSRDLKFPDGRTLTLYDGVKAKTTWPVLSDPEIGTLGSKWARPDCGANGRERMLLRHEQMEGVDVAVIQQSSGSFRITTWEAPSLGCQHLYVKSEQMNSFGGFRVSAETQTTRLLVGEPDPRLFEVAPELVEMKPSEAEQLWLDSLKIDFDALGLNAQEKAAMQRELQSELQREGAEADKRYQGKEK